MKMKVIRNLSESLRGINIFIFRIWGELSEKKKKKKGVKWERLIWYSLHITRHLIIVWMRTDVTCTFCNKDMKLKIIFCLNMPSQGKHEKEF